MKWTFHDREFLGKEKDDRETDIFFAGVLHAVIAIAPMFAIYVAMLTEVNVHLSLIASGIVALWLTALKFFIWPKYAVKISNWAINNKSKDRGASCLD